MTLDRDRIYKVLQLSERYASYGECYLTKLISDRGERLTIFAPRHLQHRIQHERPVGYSPFFVPLGQEKKNGKMFNT